MFNFFADVKKLWATVAAVWPAVDTFVQQVELAFPAGTAGATKLAAVRAFLESAWATLTGVETTFASAWPTLEALITTLVTLYNTIGLFNHKPSAP